MSDKPELLEVTMTREIKVLYFHSMNESPEFHWKPFLDRDMFRRHFATVAHGHGIFHKEGPEGRSRYNLYFGLCWNRMTEAIRRLARNEAGHHPPVRPVAVILRELEQKPEASPMTAEAARKRLAVLRETLAQRPISAYQ